MSSTIEKIKKLGKQLYPRGRAFKFPKGGNMEKLNAALSQSEQRAFDDGVSILDEVLPDNANFTTKDATRWEFRLGMITNPAVSLDDRKLAIIRKMNHPGEIPARQSWDYIEETLQAAGFDVYVHENIPPTSIEAVLALPFAFGQLGQSQLGQSQLGNVYNIYPDLFSCAQLGVGQLGQFSLAQCWYNNKIVNNIEAAKDANWPVGAFKKHTFFIGAATLGEFADVDATRIDEFRQLILRLKPAQAVGYLLINYV